MTQCMVQILSPGRGSQPDGQSRCSSVMPTYDSPPHSVGLDGAVNSGGVKEGGS